MIVVKVTCPTCQVKLKLACHTREGNRIHCPQCLETFRYRSALAQPEFETPHVVFCSACAARLVVRGPASVEGRRIRCPQCRRITIGSSQEEILPGFDDRSSFAASNILEAELSDSADEFSPPLSPLQPDPLDNASSELPAEKYRNNQDRELLSGKWKCDMGSEAAFLAGSLGLLCASLPVLELLTKPLSALGLLIGLGSGVLCVKKQKPLRFSLVISSLCLLVLLFLGRWPESTRSGILKVVPLQSPTMAAQQILREGDYVNAAENVIHLDDLRVAIVRVRVGQVKFQNGGTTTEKNLEIHVRVGSEGKRYPYESWVDGESSPSQHPPSLTDNQDHPYTPVILIGRKITGRSEKEYVGPGPVLEEVLLFPEPPTDVEYLRLTLPASAFGFLGDFHFQIPREMIEDLE